MIDWLMNIWYWVRFSFVKFSKPQRIETPEGMKRILEYDFSHDLWEYFNKYYAEHSEDPSKQCLPSVDNIMPYFGGIDLESMVSGNTNEYPFSTAFLSTKGKQSFHYGLFELICKVPEHEGMFWPAFWLYGEQWPPEIDIFEMMNTQAIENKGTQYFSTTYHWSKNGVHKQKGRRLKSKQILSDEYHKYSLLWTKEKMVWYFDDMPIYQITGNSPKKPMYIIINTASGATVESMGNKIGVLDVKLLTVYEFKDEE
jgi:beta-glucanase (GH16 family)